MPGVKAKKFALIVLEFCGLFIVLGGVLFLVANNEALRARLSYWWSEKTGQTVTQDLAHLTQASSVTGDRLAIPRLGLVVPLSPARTNEEPDMLAALEKGVVRYPGTAKPGEPGVMFVTGQSSNYAWAPGQYKAVFALLDKLKPGDDIAVFYADQTYACRVTGQRIISPNDLSVLEAVPGQKIKSLGEIMR